MKLLFLYLQVLISLNQKEVYNRVRITFLLICDNQQPIKHCEESK